MQRKQSVTFKMSFLYLLFFYKFSFHAGTPINVPASLKICSCSDFLTHHRTIVLPYLNIFAECPIANGGIVGLIAVHVGDELIHLLEALVSILKTVIETMTGHENEETLWPGWDGENSIKRRDERFNLRHWKVNTKKATRSWGNICPISATPRRTASLTVCATSTWAQVWLCISPVSQILSFTLITEFQPQKKITRSNLKTLE